MKALLVAFLLIALSLGEECAEQNVVINDDLHLGESITVVINCKEVPSTGQATIRVIDTLPDDVYVYIIPFQPNTNDRELKVYERLAEERERTVLFMDSPAVNFLGDSRNSIVQSGLIQTPYTLFVENIAHFEEGFLEEFWARVQEVKAVEEATNEPRRTKVFLPLMLEVCTVNEPGFWSKDFRPNSHSEFHPHVLHNENLGIYWLNTGFRVNDAKALHDGHQPARVGQQTSPVPGAYYVDYIEDHVLLIETEFYKEHNGHFSNMDLLWQEDHLNHAAITRHFGGRACSFDLLCQMEYFCAFNLETLHLLAVRRGDVPSIRTSISMKRVFGVLITHNSFAWPRGVRDDVGSYAQVPDVIGQFPDFDLSAPRAVERHVNLFFSMLFFASHSEVQFRVVAHSLASGDERQLEATTWLDHTETLRWLNKRYGVEADVDDAVEEGEEIRVYAKSRVHVPTDEEWDEIEANSPYDYSTLSHGYIGSVPLAVVEGRARSYSTVPYVTCVKREPMEKADLKKSFLVLRENFDGLEQRTVYTVHSASACSDKSVQWVHDETVYRLPVSSDDHSFAVVSYTYNMNV